MIILIIKRSDNTIYWKEAFNSLEEAQKWLAIEQTRKYWDETFTHEFIDNSSDEAAQQEADQAIEDARKASKLSGAGKLVGIGGLTKAEINALFGTSLK